MKIDESEVIKAYNEGESMNFIAKKFGTYANTICRILKRNKVELRHDAKREGVLYIKDGDKLIEWAKKQKRLVTKTELAHVIGRKRLSPYYFIKNPELGQYIKPDAQTDLQKYYYQLYEWLQKNNIKYKPNDRTKIKVSLDALLLEDYSDIAIHILEKPKCVSKKDYDYGIKTRIERAKKAGISIVFLNKECFEDLDSIKNVLDDLKTKGETTNGKSKCDVY